MMVDVSNVNPQLYDILAANMDALDANEAFTVTVHEETVWKLTFPGGVYPPERVLWDDGVEATSLEGWELVTGIQRMTGRVDGVHHPSERIGRAVAEHLVYLSQDEPQTFAAVVVECEPTTDGEEPGLVGWAILQKV